MTSSTSPAPWPAKPLVCVLFGGVSTEHLVSCRSAANLLSGLRTAGFPVVPVAITRDGRFVRYDGPDDAILSGAWETDPGRWFRAEFPAGGIAGLSPGDFLAAVCGRMPDVVFPAVHGINCEDGALQGFLELTGLPYVGSGVLASAAGMDKLCTRKLLRTARIPQCRHLAVRRDAIRTDPEGESDRIAARLGFPCFLKPSNGGSSVGTRKVDDRASLPEALRDVAEYDREIVAEEYVNGREIEVAVLGNDRPKAAPPGEIVPSAAVAFYDYQAKYFLADGAAVEVPASLPPALAARVRRMAVRAYRALGCAGLARVDFFLERGTDRLLVNEINTLPGFTAISVYPKAFEAAGVPLPKLAARLVRLAYEDKAARQRRMAP